MATITTDTPFVTATAMVASKWNTKYNLLYNELNGNIDNSNIGTTAGVAESKMQFDGSSGHDHSASKAITINTGLSTTSINKGEIIYYDGSAWVALGSGAAGEQLKCSHDSYTKLMLHCDGVDGSTTITDEIGKIVTAVGNAQIDTAERYFGTGSLKLDGTGDYITIPDDADFNFSDNLFTLDFRMKLNNITSPPYFYYQDKDVDNVISLFYRSDGYLQFYAKTAGVELGFYADYYVPDTLWHHIALVRVATADASSSWAMFIDGEKKSLIKNYGTSWKMTMANCTSAVAIGCNSTGATGYLNGWLDEYRVSNGVARWASAFTASTEAYSVLPRWM